MASETKIANCPKCGSDELGHGYSWPPMQGVAQCYSCEHYVIAPTEHEAVALWNLSAPDKAGEVET